MPTTPIHALPYPQLSDRADVPHDIGALANAIDPLLVTPSTVQLRSEKNQPNGYAGLDAGGLIVASQIPSLSSLYQLVSQKGQANGYASLDASGRVPAAQLPPTGPRIAYGTATGLSITADYGSADYTVSFGITFAATPVVVVSANIGASTYWDGWHIDIQATSTTGFTVRVGRNLTGAGTVAAVNWHAIASS